MSAPNQVKQGEDYNTTFSITGDNTGGYAYLLEAKQYPDDAATISRAITLSVAGNIDVVLTPTETALLDVGLWFLTVKATDADEAIHSTQRIQVIKGWL